jgi:hypothetical protein
MGQTNTWSSKVWFKAAGEHFNNAKSSLPEVNKQTGINFTISAGTFAAHHRETPIAKIPGDLAAAPVQAVVDAGKWVADKVGEREAVKKNTISEHKVNISYSDHEGTKSKVTYMYTQDEYQIKNGTTASINNRVNKPDCAIELTDSLTPGQLDNLVKDHSLSLRNCITQTFRPETKNNETKDWQTVEKLAKEASKAAVAVGTGIVLYAFSNALTTAGNSLFEGKGVVKSLGNGVDAGKNTLGNAAYVIGEGVAAAVDYGVGTTLLCFEGAGWLGGKMWYYTAGQLPHDEQPSIEVAGEAVVDADN